MMYTNKQCKHAQLVKSFILTSFVCRILVIFVRMRTMNEHYYHNVTNLKSTQTLLYQLPMHVCGAFARDRVMVGCHG